MLCEKKFYHYNFAEITHIFTKMITQDEVRHIAKLTKLNLSENEVEKFTGQLGSILDFFGQLQEVDTDKVEETSQVTGLANVTRTDEIVVDGNENALLECTPHKVENHCVKIPRVI